MLPNADLQSCCAITYSHPLVRWLMGDSLHPGGLALTSRLAELAQIGPDSVVLDVGSGRGASAVHLAKEKGCRVVGVTLEEDGIDAGNELAHRSGVGDMVTFLHGDIQQVELRSGSFDVAMMECVFSIMPDKIATLNRVRDCLKTGGRLALTDVTVNGPLPPELEGILATAGCVGDARSLSEYTSVVEAEGFELEYVDDLPETVISLLRDIKGKMMIAEVAIKLGKVEVNEDLLAKGKEYLAQVQGLVDQGTLSYGLVVARR